jgi:protein TonB
MNNKKTSLLVFILLLYIHTTGQNCYDDILSDSTNLAEYIYNNMHYPLIDYINNVEGTAVYKYEFDSILGINQIKTVKSSGSFYLNREGERLLRQIPKGNEYPTHEISINFNLADNKVYEFVEDMPEFPGGIEEMSKFIFKNFKWPLEGAEMGITGNIFCGFIVEKDGSINIVEVLRPLERCFDAEAIRVIKKMPKWTAGKKEGKHVRVYYIVPIRIDPSF